MTKSLVPRDARFISDLRAQRCYRLVSLGSVLVCNSVYLSRCVALRRVISGLLVLQVALQHDLDPETLPRGLKGLGRLLQGKAVGHEGLHVHFP